MIHPNKFYKDSGKFRPFFTGTAAQLAAVPEGLWTVENGDLWYDTVNSVMMKRSGGAWVLATDSLTFGESPDYAAFDADGSLRFFGDATIWDDIANSLVGRKLYDSAGKVQYDWVEATIIMKKGGSFGTIADVIVWNQQLPHAAKASSFIHPHIHFTQTESNEVTWSLKYRIQSNGEAKTTDWTTIACSTDTDTVYTYVSGTINQIVKFPAIDVTGAGISATIQIKFIRDDSSDAADVDVTFVDCHVEYDSIGSRQEYIK